MGIEQGPPEFGDLGDNAPAATTVTGIVVLCRDRHVDEMPACAAANLAAVFVGPGRGVRQRFAGFEQVANDGPGLRGKSRLGQPGRGTMAHPAPGQGRSSQAQKQEGGPDGGQNNPERSPHALFCSPRRAKSPARSAGGCEARSCWPIVAAPDLSIGSERRRLRIDSMITALGSDSALAKGGAVPALIPRGPLLQGSISIDGPRGLLLVCRRGH